MNYSLPSLVVCFVEIKIAEKKIFSLLLWLVVVVSIVVVVESSSCCTLPYHPFLSPLIFELLNHASQSSHNAQVFTMLWQSWA